MIKFLRYWMRLNQYVAVLDTCVLAPMRLADTLLRLAEEPEFYAPRWSEDILTELRRTLLNFGYSPAQVDHRIEQMEATFPEAKVSGYSSLVDSMKNDPSDRHVLAAAIRCGANAIITNNKKHFPSDQLAEYSLECINADDFLRHQYHLDPDTFIDILQQQAIDTGCSLPQLISHHVPCLAELIVVKD